MAFSEDKSALPRNNPHSGFIADTFCLSQTSSDESLEQLVERWLSLHAKASAAQKCTDEAAAAVARRGVNPAGYFRSCGQVFFHTESDDAFLARTVSKWPEGVKSEAEHHLLRAFGITGFRRFKKAWNEVCDETGYLEAQAKSEAAWEALDPLEERIVAWAPTTSAEIAAKLRMARSNLGRDADPDDWCPEIVAIDQAIAFLTGTR